jgi:hypothetical protein
MAEHTVPKVVHHGGSHCHPTFMGIVAATAETTVYNGREFSSCVKYPDAMGETGMRGPRKDQFAETKLLNTPQPLEWACLDNFPKYMLELMLVRIRAGPKFDQIMDWITDPLNFSCCHGFTSAQKSAVLLLFREGLSS